MPKCSKLEGKHMICGSFVLCCCCLFTFFTCDVYLCRHTIRLLLDKWGLENVNDLIVDETVDDFEATRFNDIPIYDPKLPDPHQTPTFTDPPSAVPTDSYHHFDNGYNYPNPNKVHTVGPPMHPAPPPASTAGYLPTNHGYTVNHPGANRYWSGFSYSINQR